MSGGSFNYLCTKSASDLVDDYGHADESDLLLMLGELELLRQDGYDGAEHAVLETLCVIATIRLLREVVGDTATGLGQMHDVWQAVEWWRSGDISKEVVIETLAKFKEEKGA